MFFDLKVQAVELRCRQRLSDAEVWAQLGRDQVSRSTIHKWLKDYPLTDEEKKAKRSAVQRRAQKGRTSFYANLPVSSHWESVDESLLTKQQKGKIAENLPNVDWQVT
jgi:hypothetical protein